MEDTKSPFTGSLALDYKAATMRERRERFVMAAMQGLCASTDSMVCFDTAIAGYAVQYADALIAELDKEKP